MAATEGGISGGGGVGLAFEGELHELKFKKDSDSSGWIKKNGVHRSTLPAEPAPPPSIGRHAPEHGGGHTMLSICLRSYSLRFLSPKDSEREVGR